MPKAERIRTEILFEGHKIVDYYEWLKFNDSRTMKYITEESNYTKDKFIKPCESIIESYRAELSKLKDHHVYIHRTVVIDGWTYYENHNSFGENAFYRRKGEIIEEIFNISLFSKDLSYFNVGFFEISQDSRYLAFAYDEDGSERFRLCVVDMISKNYKLIDAEISFYYSARWDANNFLIASSVDEKGLPRKIFKIDVEMQRKELLYYEEDESLTVTVGSTNDRKYLTIEIVGQITKEVIILDGNDRLLRFRQRERNVRFNVEHWNNKFLILYGDEKHPNNELLLLNGIEDFHKQKAKVILKHSNKYLTRIESFNKAIVIWFWEKGSKNFLFLLPNESNDEFKVVMPFKPSVFPYSLMPYAIEDEEERVYRNFNDNYFSFIYSSFNEPSKIFRIHFVKQSLELVEEETNSLINFKDYSSKKIFINSIPVSIIYKGKSQPYRKPLLAYAYGAYGGMIETSFKINWYPLLDKGFTIIIAHVRGDADLGYNWYLDGKFLNKQNSFHDFATVLKYFSTNNWALPEQIVIQGRSAGGLVIGAMLFQYPHLFNTAILQVPFLDVVGDMIDINTPWTIYEYEEWGNPHNQDIFNEFLRFSPYNKLPSSHFPNVIFTAGLKDSRVGYYEPSKMVAKLRHHLPKGWKKKLYLKINPEGHFSSEHSVLYAFIDHANNKC
ncbi:hypothetical protein ROZALSC1DRAFT_31022 [Rozella allomycis CSF55]|uniref:Prolyl endopeptidase n=1 Tax=Rozella allomycis (strain CSF55) TaxID=988480 RepID=A0A4V1IZ82_ROZAC|nr:hypothetical protein ROZALSC1DRAFT_31022 [Rozella allomycis CSF55]